MEPLCQLRLKTGTKLLKKKEGIFFHIEASVTQNKVKSLCKKKVVSCAEKVIGPLLIKIFL